MFDRSRKATEAAKGPEALAEVLGRLFAARGWGRKSERVRLENAWAAAAAEFVGRARVGAVRRGVVEVEVTDGVLMQELAQFHKRRLLEAMRRQLPGQTLTDMRFRPGN